MPWPAHRRLKPVASAMRRGLHALWRWPWRGLARLARYLASRSWAVAVYQPITRRLQPLTDSLTRHLAVWHAAGAAHNAQPPRPLFAGKELEFLPAVLEVQETPPSPAGRAILWIIVGVFTAAVLWASFGRIDIVSVAQGKIIPSDHSKIIQPLEAGVIRRIHVDNGQHVEAGDVLLELDTTVSGAEQARLANEYQAARLDIARLRALLTGQAGFAAPPGSDPEVAALQQRMLTDQLEEYRARLAAADAIIAQRQAAVDGAATNVRRLEATAPILKQRVDAFKGLLAKQYVSKLQYLELKEDYINKSQELVAARQQRQQAQAALNEADENRGAIESEFKRTNQAQLAELETRAASLSKEVVKADSRTRGQRLTAPISGVVQQLAVHTIGGVVTPAQELMVIVPKEGLLEVEAWVENKDIGFVNQDQRAEIKVEAFPFTRYGTIDGKITNLSLDAVPLDKVGWAYAARVSLDRTTVQVENKTVPLTPGMNVTVEIKTGKRRLIEFFLSPLLRAAKETARER